MATTLSWALGSLTSAFLAFRWSTVPLYKDLASSLDPQAQLYYPGSEHFTNASQRWNAADMPGLNAIVRVATEQDVQKTILFANKNKIPFLTISGSHGQTSSIAKVHNGIGIFMSAMNNITVVDNGNAALIEGGVLSGDVIPYLSSYGKETLSTGCDCVGYIPVLLGGGQGWLQGRYGLAADQLLSARLVLANGTAINVSEESNPDLFWALRGAGHNFGVVTQAKVKLYDVKPEDDKWTVSSFVFTHDKLEAIYTLANEWIDSPNPPETFSHYDIFAINPGIDPINPIIIIWVYYQGSSIPKQYTDPLHALLPVAVDTSTTPLADINIHLATTRTGANCAKGLSRKMIPVSLQRYDIPALRTVLDIFTTMPPALRSSAMMLEARADNAILRVPSASTAYPHRADRLLFSPVLTYAPNASFDATADDFARRIRSALLKGSGAPLAAYVNYARGDESVEDLYGHEAWRLEKLRRLKAEFDPLRRFSFYAPIE